MTSLFFFDARSVISGSNQAVNTFHINVPSLPSSTEGTNLLAPFKAFYDAIAAYRPTGTTVIIGTRCLWADTSTWQKPVGKPGTPTFVPGKWLTPPTIVAATPANSTAGTSTNFLPPQLASVVSWRTAVSGRTGRGRTYLGNLGTAAQSNNVVNPVFVTAANSAASTLIGAVSGVTVGGTAAAFTVWSPTTGLVHQILSGAMDGTFDTMRSRVK